MVLGDDGVIYAVDIAPAVSVVSITEICEPAVRVVEDTHATVVPSIGKRVAASSGLVESMTDIV